jgi:CRISPR-associated protein (TIGR03984 family)
MPKEITLEFSNPQLEMKSFETLEKAIEATPFTENETFLLTYSPFECALTAWDRNIPKAEVYEFRLFDHKHELRCIKGASGVTSTVILREVPGENSGPYFALSGQYLLWGKVISCENGVSTLFEHRVGKINVPVPVGGCRTGDCLALSYTEYFKTDDYGNLTFFTDRLTEVAKAKI